MRTAIRGSAAPAGGGLMVVAAIGLGRAELVAEDQGRGRHRRRHLAAHASLVAREYGIPAVVATGDATTRLTDGQVVTVDGGTGTVHPHH